MKHHLGTFAAGAFALATSFVARKASADLTFCNQTWKELEITFVQQTNACSIGWGEWGWYYVSPNQCTTVYYGDLPEEYYYFFADSTDGAWYWAGSDQWWTPNAAHSPWCIDQSQSSGGEYLGYRQVDTGDYSGFTVNLTTNQPSPCPSGCFPASSDECLCPVSGP